MSVCLIKGKGYRFDFTMKGVRYTQAGFKMKREARKAEAEKRKEVLAPKPKTEIPTDMDFLELANKRLDHVKAYNSERHYKDYVYMAKRWIARWEQLKCSEMTNEMIQQFVLDRSKVSPYTANKEIRFLRATFNFGKKKNWFTTSPVDGIEFLPVDKRRAYVPDAETVNKLIFQARSDKWLRRRFPDTADYIETLQDTLGRMSEVNRLEWKDVDLDQKLLVLYTRKIDGGLTPRDVPMTERLYHILLRRYAERDDAKPWVFWNPRTGKPYQDRKKFMRRLCEKAGVKYFRFHSLRHSSASLMDNNNVSKSVIQRILGHTNRTTTDLYLHSMGDSEKEAMLVLENARKKVTHKVTHKDEMIS